MASGPEDRGGLCLVRQFERGDQRAKDMTGAADVLDKVTNALALAITENLIDEQVGQEAMVLLLGQLGIPRHTIARTTPPSTRSAAPVVAEAGTLQT